MVYLTLEHVEDEDVDFLMFKSISQLTRYMADYGVTEGFTISDAPSEEPEEYSFVEGYEGD